MADPITVFGLAANVVQFLDFGRKVFSTTRQIYYHGVSEQGHIDLDLIAKDLNGIAKGLGTSAKQPRENEQLTGNEVSIQQLAAQCQSICSEISESIEKLRARPEGAKRQKWKSFSAAIVTVWKKDRVQDLQKRMDDIRQELIIHTLISFR